MKHTSKTERQVFLMSFEEIYLQWRKKHVHDTLSLVHFLNFTAILEKESDYLNFRRHIRMNENKLIKMLYTLHIYQNQHFPQPLK